MPDSKFFGIPFGTSGDKATIPEAVQPGGTLSYTEGFGPDYERNPANDPQAKRIPRDETNELYFQITNALRFLQLYGLPEWYTGVSYPLAARVRYAGSGDMRAWVSLVTNNTAEPGTDATRWALEVPFSFDALEATVAETQALVAAGKIITPRRLGALTPTTQRLGLIELATQAEVRAALDALRAVTPSTLWDSIWFSQNHVIAGGTANALTAAVTPAPPAYYQGMRLVVQAIAENTGPATINISGLGVRDLRSPQGAALEAGALRVSQNVELVYNGSFFFVLNPQATASSLGILEIATQAEADAGTDGTRAMTPLTQSKSKPSFMQARAVPGQGGGTNVPNNAWTLMSGYSIISNFFRGASTFSAGVLTIGAGDEGLWLLTCSLREDQLGTFGMAIRITVNNIAQASDGGQTSDNTATAHGTAAVGIALAVGDVVRFQIIQTTGNSKFFDEYSLSAVRLGAS